VGGFRAFLTKTNALALAIGVIIGVSLGSLVTTLVNAIIMPPVGWILSGIDFAQIKTVIGTNAKGEEVSIGWGLFLNALIVFIVVMLVVYLISKIFIKEEEAAGPSAEEVLLTEIRDELRKPPA
jgi:large conductance mechanosensitive channel